MKRFPDQFREIQRKFSRIYTGVLGRARLTFPQYALLVLLAHDGRMCMTDASHKLHLSKPAVTNLVDRLEKNRYLRRVPCPGDRRSTLLAIRPEGRETVRGIQAHALGFFTRTLKQFDAGERRTIEHFYASLSRTLEEALAEPGEKTP